MSFQTFTATTRPEQGPPRLAALRDAMAHAGLDGVLVPRADAHQGEYVAPSDERLAWLTGFTGSAGFAAITQDRAGIFIDGRYRVQVRDQIDTGHFTPVPWPETAVSDWLTEALPHGGRVGYDPWLHTVREIEGLDTALHRRQVTLAPVANPVDALWSDRPSPPTAPANIWPESLAGRSAAEKRAACGATLREAGHDAGLLTLPDSICWLLNLRGADVAHTPLLHAFALLRADGAVDLFVEPAKVSALDLGEGVTVHEPGALLPALAAATGTMRIDPASAPMACLAALEEGGAEIARDADPCLLPKARKTETEIAATTGAHLRDGAAMARFLHWLDRNAQGGLTEIDCVRALQGFREETGALREISFDTIAGAGPHGAIVHYRVTEETNARLEPGQLFLLDSGGQYEDGTTDVTRTIAIGAPGAEERAAFTQVLRGMIAMSRLRWPKGLAGRDIDAIARAPLWAAGRDYDHGTGHGVGVYLSVHEGPQRLARTGTVALEPGMILSNEPGYYREGAFGIRIENLLVVTRAPDLPGGDDRAMLTFDTLTYVPIDRHLVDPEALTRNEREWLDRYHATVLERIGAHLPADDAEWLARACAPI